jgi:hypothetical protein
LVGSWKRRGWPGYLPAFREYTGQLVGYIDTVLTIIKKSKKGLNTATLMKKTGFSKKKIHNNVYKLKKQGKIKSVSRGV